MLEQVLEILKNAGVYAWEVTEMRTEGWEFYFIRHALDQNRAKRIYSLGIKVYQKIGEDKIGSAGAELPPTASSEEAKKLVANLAYQATLAPNKLYTLRKPSEAHAAHRDRVCVDVPAIAGDFLRTLKALPETETEDLNSYEIFASSATRRYLNSEGVDVTETYPESMAEVIVNARNGNHEIELYRMYESGSCDAAGLERDLKKAMAYGRDRLLAKPTPALGKADLILSGEDAIEVYSYFADRLDPAMICRRMSDWAIGKPIAEDVKGDRVTLTAKRELPNSSLNRAFDSEGSPIRDTVMLRDNVPEHFLGGRMFSCYMGLEDSFQPGNYAVAGGKQHEAALRQGKYLEAVEFSGFEVDSMTGDIFGEIRLAYWHDGETVTPVTGGSVSGNLRELLGELYLSAETVQYDNWSIPAVTKLNGVTVAGIE